MLRRGRAATNTQAGCAPGNCACACSSALSLLKVAQLPLCSTTHRSFAFYAVLPSRFILRGANKVRILSACFSPLRRLSVALAYGSIEHE
jgi:hypothetical protein